MNEAAKPRVQGYQPQRRSLWLGLQDNRSQIPVKEARCGHGDFEIRAPSDLPHQCPVERNTIGMSNRQNAEAPAHVTADLSEVLVMASRNSIRSRGTAT